ncbi:hypothetical protein OIU77_008012 [Salix suchowensis]|uniref:Uncharacterized protein n=1 Tax=Salix suchowensis TaxID=1278906 RepID=A0ABQ9AJH3_9ROSI|nr:hypothetical protein OIU77_008012 [Salix suchowensis]
MQGRERKRKLKPANHLEWPVG